METGRETRWRPVTPVGQAVVVDDDDRDAAPAPAPEAGADPVLVRRATIRRWSEVGQRVGYACFGLGVLLFVVAFVLQFPTPLVAAIVVVFVLGSSVLLPGIIFSYAAKAADAEDRGETFRY